MLDIEILNVLTIYCNTVDSKETKLPIAIQMQLSPRVQEVSNTIQIQGKKLVGWEDTLQIQAVIQI